MRMSRLIRSITLGLPLALVASTFAFVPLAQAAEVATLTATPTSPVVGEVVKVKTDFPGSYPVLTLEQATEDPSGGSVTWSSVSGATSKKSSSSGVYTFSYTMPDKKVWLRAIKANTTDTSAVVSLTPVATSAVLNSLADSGAGTSAKATATFSPVRSGQKTELQVLTLSTYPLNSKKTKPADDAVTNEVCDPVTGLANETDNGTCNAKPTWKTVASSTQSSSGTSSFSISNPYEVTHKYRVITTPTGGTATVSNEISYAASKTTKNTGLATVYLNTNEGASINTRTRYFRGTFAMTAGALGCSAVSEMPAKAKGRGNYSWSFSKKSFTVKLGAKTNLCGMGESKKWALVANAYDKSLMRNATAYAMGQSFSNMAWSPKTVHVDLYINGSYRGNYMLVERIDFASNRINVPSIDNPGAADNVGGGYLLEWDFRKGSDHNVTVGSRGYVGIKDPEDDKAVLNSTSRNTGKGITSGQISYINSYVDKADAALFGSNYTSSSSGWRKYIDEKSAVDYYIAMEFLKPVDGNMWASVYMYKAPDSTPGAMDGKLYFGPLWDFDLGMGSAARAGNTVSPSGWYLRDQITTSAKQSSVTWFNRLNQDSSFRSAVKARWKELYAAGLKSTVLNWYDSRANTINESAKDNFTKWSITERISSSQVVQGSLSKEVSYTRSWINSRFSYMNGQLG